MMNIYNGNATTDGQGSAVVQLPEWFETLNRDFRYQLTVIGQFAQAIVASKVSESPVRHQDGQTQCGSLVASDRHPAGRVGQRASHSGGSCRRQSVIGDCIYIPSFSAHRQRKRTSDWRTIR